MRVTYQGLALAEATLALTSSNLPWGEKSGCNQEVSLTAKMNLAEIPEAGDIKPQFWDMISPTPAVFLQRPNELQGLL